MSLVLSRLQKAICLKNHPVAVLWSDELPSGAITPGKGHEEGCVVALARRVAYEGVVAAIGRDNYGCRGAGYHLGFVEKLFTTSATSFPAACPAKCGVKAIKKRRNWWMPG